MEDIFNSPHALKVELEVLGHNLLLAQDPNSKHLGTTVWDSSMVFVKYLEKNSKKGEFSRARLQNKRVIELGAGCGLSGLGMALLGCEVLVTDQVEVLPLLLKNTERNMARAKYAASEYPHLGSIGSIEVAELDWGNQEQAEALNPPFDYIVGTDVVYKEHLLPPLLATVLSLAGPKTTLLMGYELRASGVKEQLEELFSRHFVIKKIPHSKMDAKYQHSNIDLYIMRLIRPEAQSQEEDELLVEEGLPSSQETEEIADGEAVGSFTDGANVSISDRREVGRVGSMAARLLHDVQVPST